MSQEYVDIARGCYAAWARGDWDAALAAAAPDVEYDMPPGFAERVPKGPEGVREFWKSMAESFSEWQSEPVRFIDAGDRVVVFVRERVRCRISEAKAESELAHVWSFDQQGLVNRFEVHGNCAAALAAVGMSDSEAREHLGAG